MNKRNYVFSLPLIFLMLILSTGCNSSKALKGGVIGATAGGVLGVIIAKSGSKSKGVLIGASIGGVAGALIGRYMDKQAKEIEEKVEGASVERVGEGILVTFDSGLMFGYNSYNLTTQTKNNLDELTSILKKYDDTEILAQGHTDNSGSDTYNQELSVKRASAVSDYLSRRGVPSSRFVVMGKGENDPVKSNETESGRAANRRVELVIVANDKLQKDANSGKLGAR